MWGTTKTMITTDVMPCFAMRPDQLPGVGGSAPLMVYTRSSRVVDEATGAWGIRGTLEVAGHSFATLERAGGYVALKPGLYAVGMETAKTHGILLDKNGHAIKENGKYLGKKDQARFPGSTFVGRRQMRPQHSQTNQEGNNAAILLHPGSQPSHFLGCIGVGEEDTKGIKNSGATLEKVYRLMGGFQNGKMVRLRVVGENPGKSKPKP